MPVSKRSVDVRLGAMLTTRKLPEKMIWPPVNLEKWQFQKELFGPKVVAFVVLMIDVVSVGAFVC
jgi:hypothetical protein